MKETIEYYYNLSIEKLYIENDIYHFIIDNYDYYFSFYSRTSNDLNDILSCINELLFKNINVHKIILNINGDYLTKVDDVNYVLLKVNNKMEEINILDMIHYDEKLILNINKNGLYRNNWSLLWSKKIDYIENQLKEIDSDNIVSSIVDYYIGLTENAIYYVNTVNKEYTISNKDHVVLSHKRIYYPNYSLNYFNPLTFIFDLEVRDISEYIKSFFWAGDDALLELETYLKCAKLGTYSYNMLYARLLYPSYFFDLYEKIVNKNDSSEKLLFMLSKNKAYEEFLKKAYKLISLYAPLKSVSWLKN